MQTTPSKNQDGLQFIIFQLLQGTTLDCWNIMSVTSANCGLEREPDPRPELDPESQLRERPIHAPRYIQKSDRSSRSEELTRIQFLHNHVWGRDLFQLKFMSSTISC